MSSNQIITTTNTNQSNKQFAFVTLLTSDSYLPGALTCLKSLQDSESNSSNEDKVEVNSFETVCLVTPNTVSQNSIKTLEKCFDKVIGVETITTTSWNELNLLGRNDLATSLTKLHLFRLTQYKKIIYLDADTLILRSISNLFNLSYSFSASPDSGWPDSFNSGVMVCTPNEKTFDELIELMKLKGSWDGGDQGLLNEFFEKDWNRLSFTFNVTPSAYYTYAPAYRRHGETTSILHFIGSEKPWSKGSRQESNQSNNSNSGIDYYNLIGKWFDVFERHFGQCSTFDVGSRVVNPPNSFKKSSFTNLPDRNLNIPTSTSSTPIPSTTSATPSIPIPIISSSTTDQQQWDPSKSSPPRNSTQLQMKEPLTTKYDNIWDDPNKSNQRTRFNPPTKYAEVPKETHEWYHNIIKNKPDPSAVRAVFPWEEVKSTPAITSNPSTSTSSSNYLSDLPPSARIASRKFPADELPRALPNINSSSANDYLLTTPSMVSPTFTNAWDSIPGIKKYAKNLAKLSAAKDLAERNEGNNKKNKGKVGGGGGGEIATSASRSGGIDNQGVGWKSSLKEMREYQRGDASSRDGDDEDDEEDNLEEEPPTETEEEGDTELEEEERDRVKINFKVKSGQSTPTNARSRATSLTDSNSTITPSSSTSSSNTTPTSTSSSTPSIKARKPVVPVPISPRLGVRQLHQSHPSTHERRLSSTVPTTPFPSDLLDPPTSATGRSSISTTAIRNSAALNARLSGSGTGNGPVLNLRATRVFSDKTDTREIKREGLKTLRRFMEMENNPNANSAEGGEGGVGGVSNNDRGANVGGSSGAGGSGGRYMF